MNKMGIEKPDRESVLNTLFGHGRIHEVDANTTVDFSSRFIEKSMKDSKSTTPRI